jgi:SAM-dependent methyltransferase
MEKKIVNINHWYDGWFYDNIIAPNQDTSYRIVKSLIKDKATILDVGCGTGRLSVKLSGKYSLYNGVDPSKRNIETAIKKQNSQSNEIVFYHSDIMSFLKNNSRYFDVAILSYVIHEIDEEKRIEILKTISDFAEKIIIVDYSSSSQSGFWRVLNEVVEFAAGKKHYNNYKNFLKGNGITGLVEKSNLMLIKEIKNKPTTSHIAVIGKKPLPK